MEQNVSTEKKSSEVIVVTSGKGGVGKTTTSANVGTGLAKAGSKVCLIDTDIGLRNLDVVMGLENRIVYNLVDVVEGNCRIKQALIRDKRHPGLYLMPSAQTRDKSAVTPGQMVKVIDHLREQFDYIILDCPAGIEQGFQNAIAGADRALVVTTPEVSAIRDADRIIGLLEANGFKQMDLIINRLRMDMVKRGDMMSADDVVDILAVPLIGIVPDDENVVIATNQGEPLVGSDTPAGKAYRNVVDRVLGKEIPFLDFEKEYLLDKSNRYFSESIGRGRDEYETFFRRKSSCQVAKDRLKILLISDRVNCSPEMMELIKADITKVISKYMRIDTDHMEIEIQAKGSKGGRNKSPSLIANIPIIDLQKTAKMP